MLAKLEFNLPEDEVAHLNALNGGKYARVLTALDEYLRAEISLCPVDDYDTRDYRQIRDELYSLLGKEGVSLE